MGDMTSGKADRDRRTLQQVMDLWIGPEVRRRRAAGEVLRDEDVRCAQVVFDLEAAHPVVRINDEVKTIASARLPKDCLAPAPGTVIDMADIAAIERLRLTEEEPNAGHVTAYRVRDTWHFSYDFRYNKGRVRDHLTAAEEFLSCSEAMLAVRRMRPWAENLYAACELMAKVYLFLLPDKEILNAKRHALVEARFFAQRKRDDAISEIAVVYAKLQRSRRSARYLRARFDNEQAESERMTAVARAFYLALAQRALSHLAI